MRYKHLNFIPKELRPKLEVPHEVLPFGLVLFFMGFGIFGPVKISMMTGSSQRELAELQATNEELVKKVKSLSEESRIAERKSESVQAIEKVLGRKNYWSEIFKEMSMLIPSGVWLTNFTHQAAKEGVKAPEQLLVRGESTSQLGMVKFLGTLEKSHYFSGARLISSERMKEVSPPKYRFEFSIPVRASEGGKG